MSGSVAAVLSDTGQDTLLSYFGEDVYACNGSHETLLYLVNFSHSIVSERHH